MIYEVNLLMNTLDRLIYIAVAGGGPMKLMITLACLLKTYSQIDNKMAGPKCWSVALYTV